MYKTSHLRLTFLHNWYYYSFGLLVNGFICIYFIIIISGSISGFYNLIPVCIFIILKLIFIYIFIFAIFILIGFDDLLEITHNVYNRYFTLINFEYNN